MHSVMQNKINQLLFGKTKTRLNEIRDQLIEKNSALHKNNQVGFRHKRHFVHKDAAIAVTERWNRLHKDLLDDYQAYMEASSKYQMEYDQINGMLSYIFAKNVSEKTLYSFLPEKIVSTLKAHNWKFPETSDITIEKIEARYSAELRLIKQIVLRDVLI